MMPQETPLARDRSMFGSFCPKKSVSGGLPGAASWLTLCSAEESSAAAGTLFCTFVIFLTQVAHGQNPQESRH